MFFACSMCVARAHGSMRRGDVARQSASRVRARGGLGADVRGVDSRSVERARAIGTMKAALRCAFAVTGIFAAFSYFALAQEDVYKRTHGGERFAATFFVLACERLVNVCFAVAGVLACGGSGVRVPHAEIFKSGASQMFAMAASNEALRYVSYPTQVLGKSCKMVPVMIGGLVLGGRTFTAAQYAQVFFITLGVTIFNLGADAKKKGGDDSPYGLTLIGVSLVMDAVTGGLQDRVKRTTKALNPKKTNAKPSVYESMLYTNISGMFVAFGFAAVTGQLQSGLKACVAHVDLARAVLVYSLASAVGQNFIYYTITNFDVLVLTTVTTTRKIFSTVYSVFRNPDNALSTTQWFGCSLVFVFLAVDAASAALRAPRAPRVPSSARSAPPAKRDSSRANARRATLSSSSTTRRRSARRQ